MYERRWLVENLQRALRLGRWSEVQAVVDQLRGSAGIEKAAIEKSEWRRRLLPIVGKKGEAVNGKGLGARSEGRGARGAAAAESGAGRFVLWVDAVGGFLVCLADRVVVGQSAPESLTGSERGAENAAHEKTDPKIDIPILGDLSRRHAVIRRDGEGYWVEPLRDTRLDGRTVAEPTTLDDACVIELGGVRLRFRRPHPLSATARLEPVSYHRTHPSTDGVLLMADTCILSRDRSSHIHVPDLEGQVILFLQGDGLACSAPGNLEIDGKTYPRRGLVGPGSRVIGEGFSFTLEAV